MTLNLWRRSLTDRPLAISHRGHSIAYPENTRIAYEQAIELGAEMIECDVNITQDGVLVMMHDWKLDRTTNGAGRVSDATWDEIQRLDAGRKFNERFADASVPLTEDTLLFYREAGIYGCFEVKGEGEGWAFVAEPRFPGWTTTILSSAGERAVTPRPALGAFQKVETPAGPWTLRWRYEPGSWKLGLAAAALAWLMLAWSWYHRALASGGAR